MNTLLDEIKEDALKNISQKFPDIDYGLDPQDEHYESIVIDRYNRKFEMKDCFIITRNSKNRGTLYVQHPRFSNKYIWTQFENNALTFSNKSAAEKYIKDHHLQGSTIERCD